MQKSVGIVLYNSNGKMLLQHRTDDAPSDPSKWAIFGGGVESEELSEQAVVRETKEELNY